MECILCKIIDNQIASRKIYEDEDNIAILDINPASPGHVLVVPKKHADSIFAMDSLDLRRMIEVVKLVAEKMKKELRADNLNIILNNGKLAGQIIDHVHFHVVPRFPNDRINFTIPRYQMTDEQFWEVQSKLVINTELPPKPEPKPEAVEQGKSE